MSTYFPDYSNFPLTPLSKLAFSCWLYKARPDDVCCTVAVMSFVNVPSAILRNPTGVE